MSALIIDYAIIVPNSNILSILLEVDATQRLQWSEYITRALESPKNGEEGDGNLRIQKQWSYQLPAQRITRSSTGPLTVKYKEGKEVLSLVRAEPSNSFFHLRALSTCFKSLLNTHESTACSLSISSWESAGDTYSWSAGKVGAYSGSSRNGKGHKGVTHWILNW